MDEKFSCDCCGACCKNIRRSTFYTEELDRGDGVCKHLTAENLCEIYSERPPLCNGEYLYKNFYHDMTVAEFHQMMNELCGAIRGWELERLHKEISDA